MGQASQFKPIALVVEDDKMQREMVVILLEESEMGVIRCESAAVSSLRWLGEGSYPSRISWNRCPLRYMQKL
jgi:hypothetical protein